MGTLVVTIIAALWQAAAHYMPWRKFLGGELPRVPAYIIGMLGIALPVTGWAILAEELLSALVLWAAILTSGAVVSGLYALDYALEQKAKAADLGEQVQYLEREK